MSRDTELNLDRSTVLKRPDPGRLVKGQGLPSSRDVVGSSTTNRPSRSG